MKDRRQKRQRVERKEGMRGQGDRVDRETAEWNKRDGEQWLSLVQRRQ